MFSQLNQINAPSELATIKSRGGEVAPLAQPNAIGITKSQECNRSVHCERYQHFGYQSGAATLADLTSLLEIGYRHVASDARCAHRRTQVIPQIYETRHGDFIGSDIAADGREAGDRADIRAVGAGQTESGSADRRTHGVAGRVGYASPADDGAFKIRTAQRDRTDRVSPVTTAGRVGAATDGPSGVSPIAAPPRRSSVGAQFDRNTAVAALTAAREALANTWRNRHVPLTGWVGRHMEQNYPFWRAANLERVMRCRAAVALTEARVRAVMAAG